MDNESPNDSQVQGEVSLKNSKGLHARPSHALVSMALDFNSEIEIQCRTTTANAKSILETLTLAAACGDKLTIRAVGEDSRTALQSLIELVESGFDED